MRFIGPVQALPSAAAAPAASAPVVRHTPPSAAWRVPVTLTPPPRRNSGQMTRETSMREINERLPAPLRYRSTDVHRGPVLITDSGRRLRPERGVRRRRRPTGKR